VNEEALTALFEYMDCRIRELIEDPSKSWDLPDGAAAFWKEEFIRELAKVAA